LVGLGVGGKEVIGKIVIGVRGIIREVRGGIRMGGRGVSDCVLPVHCSSLKKLQWIPTKILHSYYRDSAEDKLCVERCLLSCIVPDSLSDPLRMERMIHVYYSLEDENAVKCVGMG
jgi:hypothetical protein